MIKSALPSREQARVLLPLGSAMALSLTGDSTMYAVLPNQIATVGIALASVGILLGANRLIRIPGNVMAGALNDRLGRRGLFLTGISLGILSTLSYSYASGVGQLLAGRLLWGIAWSLINVGGYTMVVDLSTAGDRGRISGFYQTAFMLGLTISPLIGGALTDALGFRVAMRACAAVSSLGLAFALLALPETRQYADGSPRAAVSLSWRRWVAQMAGFLRQLDRRVVLAGSLFCLILFVNSGVLMSTISLYLGRTWGGGLRIGQAVIGVSSLAGILLALRSLLGMFAGPLAGTLSDRLPSRWPVIRGALCLGVAGFATLALPARIGSVVSGVALVSASTGALAAALMALVGDLAADGRPGVTMGALATAGDIGSAAGPLVAYALAARFDLRWVYVSCGIALAIGLLATLHDGWRLAPAVDA